MEKNLFGDSDKARAIKKQIIELFEKPDSTAD